MLTTASDYQMVDVSAFSDRITGGIVPALEATGQECLPLRFEDFLFLQEAYLQRMNWNKALPAEKTAPPSNSVRLIDSSYYFSETSTFVTLYCVPPDANLKGDFLLSGGSVSAKETFYTGGDWDFRPTVSPASYGVLDVDVLRFRYHNMSQVNRMSVSVSNGDMLESIVQTITFLDDGSSSSSVVTNLSRPTIYSATADSTLRASFNYKDSMLVCPWAVDASLYAGVRVQYLGSSYDAYIALRCEIVNGAVKPPSLSSIAQRAAALVGCPYSDGSSSSDESVRMYLFSSKLIVTNEFTAETDSLNWTY